MPAVARSVNWLSTLYGLLNRISVTVPMPGDALRHRLGDLDAVDRRRQDAAGIARALAGREQAGGVEALEIVAAREAHRRRGARLDPGHDDVGMVVAGDLAPEDRDRLAHRLDREMRAGIAKGRSGSRPGDRTGSRCRASVDGRPARKSPTRWAGAL